METSQHGKKNTLSSGCAHKRSPKQYPAQHNKSTANWDINQQNTVTYFHRNVTF